MTLYVDTDRRTQIMFNHTATHILNHVLRDVLGSATEQKGSLVAPDRLRFDFNCKGALGKNKIKDIEDKACNFIKRKLKVYADTVKLNIAKNINGLRAVFGECYPDPVRIVSVGVPIQELLENSIESQLAMQFPVEFCGGTHVHNSGHIGLFKLISEDAVAKGIIVVNFLNEISRK